MIPLLLLLSILRNTGGALFATPLYAHYSDVLKIKCEALPYRSVYVERNCYFAIDSEDSSSRTSEKCSLVIGGARLAKDVPTAVWTRLFADKNDHCLEGSFSSNKKKAMCYYENRNAENSSDRPKTNESSASEGDQMITARMHLPFRQQFTEGVEVGQTVVFKGVVTAPATAFVINFQRGDKATAETRDSGGDIPFHMSFRIREGIVVFGSLIKGKWTREKQLKNTIKAGDTVDIRVFVRETSYQVFLNGKELYSYIAEKATPFTLIDHLLVYGDGYINYAKLGDKYSAVPRSDDLPSLSSGLINEGEQLVTKRSYLPHLAPLDKKLEVGQTIVIKGGTTADCNNYVINFQSGTKTTNESRYQGGDIPFHISFRLRSPTEVIFGTLTNKKWTPEQRVANPLKRDADVDLRVRILADRFQVFFNGKQLYVYKAKLPLALIDHVLVYGQGYVNKVEVEDKYIPSSVVSSIPHGFPVCGRQSCSALIQMFSRRFELADCKSLVIAGVVNAQSFSIKLTRKNGDVALHFNPRFDKKTIALNTYKDGKWLDDQIVNKLPFERNVRFEISITNEANAFQIFVNGVHFASHAHRTCSSDINVLDIQGILDVDVLSK